MPEPAATLAASPSPMSTASCARVTRAELQSIPVVELGRTGARARGPDSVVAQVSKYAVWCVA